MTSISQTVTPTTQRSSVDAQAVGAGYGAIITMGFAIVVAMWSIGFISRLQVGGGTGAGRVLVPSWLVAIFLAGTVIYGGYLARRWSSGGILTGVKAGFVAGLLNLLIIAGIIMQPSAGGTLMAAAVWIPGSILATMLLTGFGAALAGTRTDQGRDANWLGLFAKVTAAATFVLLMVGGAVTAQDAGLAVVDWPNTEGYLMWAFPLAKMTGGIYYEHSHRLFGSLVGLSTVVLAVYITLRDERGWLKQLAWSAVVLVLIQGILGGLRVTGKLTLSTDASETAPSLTLAIVHGVLGQVFFSVVIALWVFTSTRWGAVLETIRHESSRTDRRMALTLYGMLVVQLMLGALVRHWLSNAGHVESGNVNIVLALHIVMAVGVSIVSFFAGARALENYSSAAPIGKLGVVLLGLISWQLLLGCVAYIVIYLGDPQPRPPTGLDALVTTLHQSTGALLLGLAMMLVLWTQRLLSDPSEMEVSQQADRMPASESAGAS
jgi:cytochrome c oxidase assembly protein subunit 15